jgi:hypothetical protein
MQGHRSDYDFNIVYQGRECLYFRVTFRFNLFVMPRKRQDKLGMREAGKVRLERWAFLWSDSHQASARMIKV